MQKRKALAGFASFEKRLSKYQRTSESGARSEVKSDGSTSDSDEVEEVNPRETVKSTQKSPTSKRNTRSQKSKKDTKKDTEKDKAAKGKEVKSTKKKGATSDQDQTEQADPFSNLSAEEQEKVVTSLSNVKKEVGEVRSIMGADGHELLRQILNDVYTTPTKRSAGELIGKMEARLASLSERTRKRNATKPIGGEEPATPSKAPKS